MRTTQKSAVGIIYAQRAGHDVNGNPRFEVVFRTDGGAVVCGKTPAGASYCYSMPRSGRARCSWHVTPTGRVVFDDITEG